MKFEVVSIDDNNQNNIMPMLKKKNDIWLFTFYLRYTFKFRALHILIYIKFSNSLT